jgi:hypothetical protein
MRRGLVFWLVLVVTPAVWVPAAQDNAADRRYAIQPNLEKYPQGTPKETLASVIAAIEERRIDYLLAQLADPDFVDGRVKDVYKGQFDELVAETKRKLADNPDTLKELQRFLKEGEWDSVENTASASLKDVKDRKVFMKKIGKRWYLENKQKEESK